MRPNEYIAGDRLSRAAHDLELEAMCDELLAEALEGFEATPGNHTAAVEGLRERLAARISQSTPARIDSPVIAASDASPDSMPSRPIRIRRPVSPSSLHRWRLVSMAGVLLFMLLAVYTITNRNMPPMPETERAIAIVTDTLRTPPQMPDTTASPASATLPAVEKRTLPSRRAAAASGDKVIADAKRSKEGPGTESQSKQEHDAWLDNSQPLDPVVVVAYGTKKKGDLTGSIAKPKSGDTTRTVISKGLLDTLACGSPIVAQKAETAPALAENPIEEPPFVAAGTPPSFQGGDLMAFRQWVQERIHKPEIAQSSGIPGYMVVSFVIDTDGRLTNIQVLQSPDRFWSKELVRIMKSSPRWSPGLQRDTPVRVKMMMRIRLHE